MINSSVSSLIHSLNKHVPARLWASDINTTGNIISIFQGLTYLVKKKNTDRTLGECDFMSLCVSVREKKEHEAARILQLN